jgi:hypothetical protein
MPRAGDPLHEMPIGQQVGLIAVDFATRRRVRINGTLLGTDSAGMTVRVEQSYGNCPKYIHRRAINVGAFAAPPSIPAKRATFLGPADQAMIAASDTFFLGTTPSHTGQRRVPPGRAIRVCPGRLPRPPMVAGLPGEQHVQQLWQLGGRR